MAALARAVAAPSVASVMADAGLLLVIVACVPIAILALGAPLAILLNLVLRLIALF